MKAIALLLALPALSWSQAIRQSGPSALLTGLSISPSSVTITNVASGGVIFSTTSGVLTDDPANFFYKQSDSGGPLLGVGTSSPGTTLHVASGTLTVNGTGAQITVGGNIVSRVSADLGNASRGIEVVPNTFDGEQRVRAYGNTTGTLELQMYNTGDNAVEASITLDPSPAAIGFNVGNGVAATRKVTIGATGNVGVNDASPDAQLEVVSNSAEAGVIVAVSSQSDTVGDIISVFGTGQVQIGSTGGSIASGTLFIKNAGGTSATDNLLQIQTTGGGGIGRYFGIDTTNKYMYDRMNDDATYGWAWQNASGTNRLMTLRRDGSSRVRLGVNDEAPAATLDIISNETPTGYVLYVSSQNEGAMLAVRGNGDVEIGAASTISTFTATGQLRMQLTATQTIAAGNTIAADACGGIKMITAGGAVTTDTTNTFTAPAVGNRGCCMDVVVDTASGGAITLDNNANFKSAGAADVVLGANDSARVCSNGALWYQIGATGNN